MLPTGWTHSDPLDVLKDAPYPGDGVRVLLCHAICCELDGVIAIKSGVLLLANNKLSPVWFKLELTKHGG